MSACFCCSNQSFAECCEPLLKGEKEAATPEALMRSRYSAFCTKNLDYVVETTDPQARHDMDKESTRAWMNDAQFSKLEVLASLSEGNKGSVEFKAYYRMNDQDHIHHEFSKFRKQSGVWYFRDGRVIPAASAVQR
jgi:SEC-C motif-containing protein